MSEYSSRALSAEAQAERLLDEIERLTAEIERLREALEDISTDKSYLHGTGPSALKMQMIARRALKPESK